MSNKLQIGDWVKLINNITIAHKRGFTEPWGSWHSKHEGGIFRIINITSETEKDKESYTLYVKKNTTVFNVPIECLEIINAHVPKGWYPIHVKPNMEQKRNYNVFVGINTDGGINLIYTHHNGWHIYNGDILGELVAWTGFADWPKEFDLDTTKDTDWTPGRSGKDGY